MGQEAEKRIRFGLLRDVVDNAVKNRDTSIIETIEDENQLVYMQKYIDSKNTKRNAGMSFYSIFVGIMGLNAAVFAIGVSLLLTGVTSVSKAVSVVGGVLMIGLGTWMASKTNKAFKKFVIADKDAEFEHDIVLKIEEQLIYIRGKYLSKE